MSRPHRRRDDPESHAHAHRRRFLRENAYRDVWLALITGVLIFLALAANGTSRKADATARQAKAEAQLNRRLEAETHRLTLEFQQERLTNIRTGCQKSNREHATLVKRVDGTIAKQLKEGLGKGLSKAQIEQQRNQAIFLLSVADPVQNCAKLVREAQRVAKPPPRTLMPPPILPATSVSQPGHRG